MEELDNQLFSRLTAEINNYISRKIEISEGVFFSQYETIKRIMKFKNRDLAGTKITEDLRYLYYFDIISPRSDAEAKNLRFDTKDILIYSNNPTKDFPVVFITNAKLKEWMQQHGEDDKLKAAVEDFSANGNIGFKKVKGGYEMTDPLNTYIFNQKAETINDTDLMERHEMTASQLRAMTAWKHVDEIIKECGNKTFSSTTQTTPIITSAKRYEIFEFTGEVSEKEFNLANELDGGDENIFFLAKMVIAGLNKDGKGKKFVAFAEKITGTMEDWYLYAHRGKYEGRFWRKGVYEVLFDHQIRANEIANDIAKGLEWSSKVIFKSGDTQILQNIRADLDNGDVVITKDLSQLDVRLHNLDELIEDWNRLMKDADVLTNVTDVVRGAISANTPFRSLSLMNENSGKMFLFLRQKMTMPYQRVFREWVLPELVKDLKGQEIFRIVDDDDMVQKFREIAVNSWYLTNLVKIGPHDQATADAIKAEKLKEMADSDPMLKNSPEVWKGVTPRLFITITGENSGAAESIQNMIDLMALEQDPARRNWMLDRIYAMRDLPVPPRTAMTPPDQLPTAPGATPTAPTQLQPTQPAPLQAKSTSRKVSAPSK